MENIEVPIAEGNVHSHEPSDMSRWTEAAGSQTHRWRLGFHHGFPLSLSSLSAVAGDHGAKRGQHGSAMRKQNLAQDMSIKTS